MKELKEAEKSKFLPGCLSYIHINTHTHVLCIRICVFSLYPVYVITSISTASIYLFIYLFIIIPWYIKLYVLCYVNTGIKFKILVRNSEFATYKRALNLIGNLEAITQKTGEITGVCVGFLNCIRKWKYCQFWKAGSTQYSCSYWAKNFNDPVLKVIALVYSIQLVLPSSQQPASNLLPTLCPGSYWN